MSDAAADRFMAPVDAWVERSAVATAAGIMAAIAQVGWQIKDRTIRDWQARGIIPSLPCPMHEFAAQYWDDIRDVLMTRIWVSNRREE